MQAMAAWVDPALLKPPVNVMRVGLHPRGLARWTVNLSEVRAYFLGRLQRQVAITGDEHLAALLEEVAGYPAPEHEHDPASDATASRILTPLMRMRSPDGDELSFFATVATFGTASASSRSFSPASRPSSCSSTARATYPIPGCSTTSRSVCLRCPELPLRWCSAHTRHRYAAAATYLAGQRGSPLWPLSRTSCSSPRC